MCRKLADFGTVKIKFTLVLSFKAADYTERGRFSATGRAEKSYEFSVFDIKINGIKNLFTVIGF